MSSINEYITTERLRTGAGVELCRAVRTMDDQPVLLNILHRGPWFALQRSRFEQDFEIGRSLDMPCVVKPFALEENYAGMILVLEDFGGKPLDRLLAQGRLSLEDVLEFALHAAEALGDIHGFGITHKDIQPANLIYNAKTGRLKVTGFGLATALVREMPAGMIQLLPESDLAYISPEQTGRMNRSLDHRTDLYSLGVTLYECLVGQLPYTVRDALELVHCLLAREPVAPADLDPAIPAVVSQIVMKLLAKSPEDRYQSAYGLAADLRECRSQLVKTGAVHAFELGLNDRIESFRIPEKLYGREQKVDLLLQAFERTRKGKAEMMLVAGYSGVGKSALINELQEPITRRNGYFISGKCDQYKRHIPYSAIIGAFNELIRQILTEPEDRVDLWRHDLMEALSPNGQVLVDVIPGLELIIGAQPAVAQLHSTEAQNRFDMVLVNFLHVFAREKNQLVMFLDDLQWVDSSSLRLLELLITDQGSGHFLLLGAYRDNEIDSAHPLARTFEEIRTRGARISTLQLLPLTLPDVTALCTDALGCRVTQAQPLAQLVFEKTDGNPFFLRQFLQHLAAQDALAFDFDTGEWQWNTEQIRAMSITDNVVELMTGRIWKLPAPTRNALRLAACIGNRFSLGTLAVVSESTPAEISKALWDALLAEIIIPLGAGPHVPESFQGTLREIKNYRFLHDRVQEAAYLMIPPEDRKGVHLRIGRMLMRDTNENERESILFDIVNHINIGASLIDDRNELDALARLNLLAGLKAKKSTAYADARRFLLKGIDLLAPGSWSDEYDLTLSLYVEAVEIEYLNRDFDAAQRLSEIVVAKSRNLLDRVRVYVTRVEFLITQNLMLDALDAALPALEMLGYPVSGDASEFRLGTPLPRLEELDNMSRMTDPGQLAAVQLLTIITGASYQGKPELFPPIAFKLVTLCQEHGLSSLAAYAYGVYAMLLCGHLNDIEDGYYAGRLALGMLDRFHERDYECKVRFVFDSFIRHWKEPHRDIMSAFADTVQKGLETGDFVYVAYSRIWSSGYLMLTGHQLGYVEEQQRQYLDLMVKLKQENGLYPARIWRQLTLNLQGASDDKYNLYGESFNQEDMRAIEDVNVILTLFFAHFARLIQTYIYGDFTASLGHTKAAEAYEDSAVASMLSGGYVYYDALARLAAYSTMKDGEQQEAMARVDSHLSSLREWSRHAPMNFRSKVALVEAERARVKGNVGEAMHFFELACNLAREDGFPQEMAMAAERAHDFYAKLGFERFARIYILDAYNAYCLWGAYGKADDLETQYAHFFMTSINDKGPEVHTPDRRIQSFGGGLDAMTLIKASQALSGEIERDKLLDKLMRLAVENAGASRGVLIRDIDGDLRIEALAPDSIEDMNNRLSAPLEDSGLLPSAIVRLVARTRETIVLDDATVDLKFSQDPYIMERKPRSVLCMPICRNDEVIAILYLENDLSADVFKHDRLIVLNVLISQVGISLDNADLFEKQMRAEENMRRLRNYLSNIIDSMPSVLVGVDSDGTVSQWNSEAQRATGLSAGEAMGQQLTHAFPRFEGEMERVREAMQSGEVSSNPRRARKEGEETRYEDVTVYPLIANGVDGAVIRVDDVTDRVRIEEMLSQAQKMEAVGTLASGIAHDFNNLLQAISGYTQILIMKKQENDPDYNNLNSIDRAVDRAAQLVQQLLLFSRKLVTERRPVDLNQEVESVRKMLERTIPKMIDIDVHLGSRLWIISADPVQMEQILLNLGTNAADAMPDGGKLTIATENISLDEEYAQNNIGAAAGNYVLLTISDTGQGMNKETVGHIFEPFYTTKEIGKGTGLGLASVYGIVKSYGGDIICESEIGRGTTFRIYLPAIEKMDVIKPGEIETKPPQGGSETILVVDDEEPIRDFALQALKPFGYTVWTASSGEEALESYTNSPDDIDLVIMDIGMPGMGGHRCLQRLIQIDPAVKVIISSGYSINGRLNKTLEAGAAGYVGKPYQVADLLNKVRSVLDEKG